MIGHLAMALILTQLIELPIAWLLGIRQKQELIALALINVITNLPLNLSLFLLTRFASPSVSGYWFTVLLLEVLVIIIEAGLIARFLSRRKINALILSLTINLSSFAVGLIIGRIL